MGRRCPRRPTSLPCSAIASAWLSRALPLLYSAINANAEVSCASAPRCNAEAVRLAAVPERHVPTPSLSNTKLCPQLFGAMPPLSGAKPPHFGAMPPHSVPPPCLCVVAQCLSWALLRRCHATLCEARRTPVPSQSMPSHPAAPVHAISLLCRCIRNTALPQPFLATPCPRLANQGLAKAQPRLASANRRLAPAYRSTAMPPLCVTRLRHADAVLCYATALHGFATPSRCTTSPCPCVTELCPCVSSACHAAAIRHIATPTLDRPLLCPRRPATPCRCMPSPCYAAAVLCRRYSLPSQASSSHAGASCVHQSPS